MIFNGQFDFQGINLSGETLGDLASAVEYASDAAIGKLVKDTERYLERAVSSPFAALREGLQLSSNGKEATVLKAQVLWGLLGKNIITCKCKLVFFFGLNSFLGLDYNEGFMLRFRTGSKKWGTP